MVKGEVTLSGRLICSDAEQVAIVEDHLARHIELTRAEPGCIEFSVERADDTLIWRVEERFADQAAFDAHQARVSAGEWGRATAGITRDYTIRIVD